MEKTVKFNKDLFMALPNNKAHQILATQRVNQFMELSVNFKNEINNIIKQYFSCSWGEDIVNDEEDNAVNNSALSNGGRILGVYYINDNKFFIITSPNWEQTQVLYADEY